MKQKITKGNKVLGMMDTEKKTFVSFRTEKHQFHMFGDGFGASIKLLNYLNEKEIIYFIIDYQHQEVFYTEIEFLRENGEAYTDGENLVEPDEQLILPLNKWKKYEENKYETIKYKQEEIHPELNYPQKKTGQID